MTDLASIPTHPDVRVLHAEDADRALLILRQHALAVASESPRQPSSVTVSNGPLALRVQWGTGEQMRIPSGGAELPETVGAATTTDVPQADAANAELALEEGTFTLSTNTVGVFYRAAEPSAQPFVCEGDPVRAGQQVGIVEAMKLMIPVEAEREGRVVEFLVADGTAVEHGQPLILLEGIQ